MSKLSDFDAAAFSIASEVIGTVKFSIDGGPGIDVVNGEGKFERDSELGGFMSGSTKTIVLARDAFDSMYSITYQDLKGRLCSVDGEEWRIQSPTVEINYLTLDLIDPKEVS